MKSAQNFRHIYNDLKETYNLLDANPDHERVIKNDILVAQQLVSDTLKKLKKNIATADDNKNQGSLFNENHHHYY